MQEADHEQFEKIMCSQVPSSAGNKGQGDNETVCGEGAWCRLSESLSDRKYLHWGRCASQVEETGRAKGQGQEFLKQTGGKEVGGQTAL